MVDTPMRLVDALRLNGYTIDRVEIEASTITLDEGVIEIPPMLGSGLTWRRDEPEWLGADFYLSRLPVFDDAYRTVLVSHILDRFMNRRIAYSTLDEFARAVRTFINIELGPSSVFNQLWRSLAVELPLTTSDSTVTVDRTENGSESASASDSSSGTSTGTDGSTVGDTATTTDEATSTGSGKSRNVGSDYPQGQLGGNLDYASTAADTVAADDRTDNATSTREGTVTASGSSNGTTTSTSESESASSRESTGQETRRAVGRDGRTLAELLVEQRNARINVDERFLTRFETLFLGVFDRSENERNTPIGYRGYGNAFGGW